jgi:hypothetical protein
LPNNSGFSYSHSFLYDLFQKLTHASNVIPAGIQDYMVPEESLHLLIQPNGILIVAKSGALRIARDNFTMRPLDESALTLTTLLVSRSDNTSPVLSEFVRSFGRKMSHLHADNQMSLPIPV